MMRLTISRCALLAGALGIAAADQAAKLLIVRLMSPGQSITLLGPVLSLTYTRNTGGAFSLVPGSGGWLVVVSVLVVAALVLWSFLAPIRGRRIMAGVALTLGGALGNLLDRLLRGWVVDFIDFHFWPVFNVADIAITAGVILIGWHLLLPPEHSAARVGKPDSSDRTAT